MNTVGNCAKGFDSGMFQGCWTSELLLEVLGLEHVSIAAFPSLPHFHAQSNCRAGSRTTFPVFEGVSSPAQGLSWEMTIEEKPGNIDSREIDI